jgi:hypothetical protein
MDYREQLKTGHPGHPQIGEDNIGQNFSQNLEGNESILRSANRKSKAAHDRRRGAKHQRVVFHNKHPTLEKTTRIQIPPLATSMLRLGYTERFVSASGCKSQLPNYAPRAEPSQ